VYDVIGEPPSEEGVVQVITTLFPEILVVGAVGVEGTVFNIAPLPAGDGAEGPKEFFAIILALILDPIAREYGTDIKAEIGTVQVIDVLVQPA